MIELVYLQHIKTFVLRIPDKDHHGYYCSFTEWRDANLLLQIIKFGGTIEFCAVTASDNRCEGILRAAIDINGNITMTLIDRLGFSVQSTATFASRVKFIDLICTWMDK